MGSNELQIKRTPPHFTQTGPQRTLPNGSQGPWTWVMPNLGQGHAQLGPGTCPTWILHRHHGIWILHKGPHGTMVPVWASCDRGPHLPCDHGPHLGPFGGTMGPMGPWALWDQNHWPRGTVGPMVPLAPGPKWPQDPRDHVGAKSWGSARRSSFSKPSASKRLAFHLHWPQTALGPDLYAQRAKGKNSWQ